MTSKLLISLFILTFSSLASADGLFCVGQQTAIQVKLYHQVAPTVGTRKPAIMVLSSPFVKSPNKTIAKFIGGQTLFFHGNGLYEALVDLDKDPTLKKGENIAGTKLGYLKKIALDSDFSYATPVPNGKKVNATLHYTKVTGEHMSEKADCARYLKHE